MKKFISFSAVSSLFIMAGLVFSLGFTSSEVGAQGKPVLQFVDVSKPQSEPHPHFTITSSSNIFTDNLATSSFPDSPIVLPGDQPETQAYCTADCGNGYSMTCGCPGCGAVCADGIDFGGRCDVRDEGTGYSYRCG